MAPLNHYVAWSVHSNEVEVGPHFFQEVIKVPFVMCRDWDGMWNTVDDVQLLDGDLINLVQNVDAWNIDPVGCMQCYGRFHSW